MFGWKKFQRSRLRKRPIPPEWHAELQGTMPYFSLLTDEDKGELLEHMRILLAEKRFEGCLGLQVEERMRVLVAAHAGLLLLHRKTDFFPGLGTILIYPDSFIADVELPLPDGTILESTEARLGESWHWGTVILSWRDVKRDAARPERGRNLVLHEFAHQLDSETGEVDGLPVLPHRALYREWALVMGREFERLNRSLDRGRRTVLEPYAATCPAEFFAVVTEMFFLRPHALMARHGRLYRLLQAYYRQDPGARMKPPKDAESE